MAKSKKDQLEFRAVHSARVLEVRVCEAVEAPEYDGRAMRGAHDVEAVLRPLLKHEHREAFVVLLVDAKNRLSGLHVASVGCLTWSVVHPREVFLVAVREQAAAIIVAHNHPSGDPEPSEQDIVLTERLVKAGEVLGIPLLDHVIIGSRRAVSLRARGDMPS